MSHAAASQLRGEIVRHGGGGGNYVLLQFTRVGFLLILSHVFAFQVLLKFVTTGVKHKGRKYPLLLSAWISTKVIRVKENLKKKKSLGGISFLSVFL